MSIHGVINGKLCLCLFQVLPYLRYCESHSTYFILTQRSAMFSHLSSLTQRDFPFINSCTSACLLFNFVLSKNEFGSTNEWIVAAKFQEEYCTYLTTHFFPSTRAVLICILTNKCANYKSSKIRSGGTSARQHLAIS